MTDHQAAIASGFYDHEMDSALDKERRAADWGADEVFATTPRRRFRKSHRRAEEPESWLPRTDELALDRLRRDAGERRPGHARSASRPVALEREAAVGPKVLVELGATGAIDQAAVEADRAATEAAARAATEATERAAAETVEDGADVEFTGMRAEPAGRRTVVVTGRPEGEPPIRPLRTERRRPPRTVADHVGGRPDRIAAWAFGLGLTLILVAVTTAEAAPM